MKLKARDLIVGWPKPRSIVRFPAGNFFLLADHRALAQYAESVRYHEEQQRMVTAYLELWRCPWVDAKMRPLSTGVNKVNPLQRLKDRGEFGVALTIASTSDVCNDTSLDLKRSKP